ncbi:MAG: hypothetical protein AVDCRST_MAG22-2440, partial [uncultured Rubrobacteraceae bacterium]
WPPYSSRWAGSWPLRRRWKRSRGPARIPTSFWTVTRVVTGARCPQQTRRRMTSPSARATGSFRPIRWVPGKSGSLPRPTDPRLAFFCPKIT